MDRTKKAKTHVFQMINFEHVDFMYHKEFDIFNKESDISLSRLSKAKFMFLKEALTCMLWPS